MSTDGSEINFEEMLDRAADRASEISEERADARRDAAYRSRLHNDLRERGAALQNQRNAIDGLAKLGMPDFVMDVSKPGEGDMAEIARATEAATEGVELAQQKLREVSDHLSDVLNSLIERLNGRLPDGDRLDARGERTPRQYMAYLKSHPVAGPATGDAIYAYFDERFAAVAEAERELNEAQIVLERIVGPEAGAGSSPEERAKGLMREIAQSRDVIVGAEQNPYVDDHIWKSAPQIDASGKVVTESVPGEAERERKARDEAARGMAFMATRRMDIGNVEVGKSPTDPLFRYYEGTFNKFIDEAVKRRQTVPGSETYSLNDNDGYKMQGGFERPRDPSLLHTSERHSAPTGMGLEGEQLAQVLGLGTGFPYLAMDRVSLLAHLSSMQRLKALAEVDKGAMDMFPHSREWNGQRGLVSDNMRRMGIQVVEGEALIPDDWREDPTKRDAIAAANAEYQGALKLARDAVETNRRSHLDRLESRLAKLRSDATLYARVNEDIRKLNESGMLPEDLTRLNELESELRRVTQQRNVIRDKRPGLFYPNEKKQIELGKAESEVAAALEKVNAHKQLGEQHRQERIAALRGELSTLISSFDAAYYDREIASTEGLIAGVRAQLDRLGQRQ